MTNDQASVSRATEQRRSNLDSMPVLARSGDPTQKALLALMRELSQHILKTESRAQALELMIMALLPTDKALAWHQVLAQLKEDLHQQALNNLEGQSSAFAAWLDERPSGAPKLPGG